VFRAQGWDARHPTVRPANLIRSCERRPKGVGGEERGGRQRPAVSVTSSASSLTFVCNPGTGKKEGRGRERESLWPKTLACHFKQHGRWWCGGGGKGGRKGGGGEKRIAAGGEQAPPIPGYFFHPTNFLLRWSLSGGERKRRGSCQGACRR